VEAECWLVAQGLVKEEVHMVLRVVDKAGG
jgi:hypothetical protein